MLKVFNLFLHGLYSSFGVSLMALQNILRHIDRGGFVIWTHVLNLHLPEPYAAL